MISGNVQAKKTLDPGTYSVDLIVKDQCETTTTGTLYINVIDDVCTCIHMIPFQLFAYWVFMVLLTSADFFQN